MREVINTKSSVSVSYCRICRTCRQPFFLQINVKMMRGAFTFIFFGPFFKYYCGCAVDVALIFILSLFVACSGFGGVGTPQHPRRYAAEAARKEKQRALAWARLQLRQAEASDPNYKTPQVWRVLNFYWHQGRPEV